MAGVEWFVTLEGVEQGPLTPAEVKELVQAGMIGPMTPIRRGGMERAVAAAQVKGLLPPEMVAQSGVDGRPASVSERNQAAGELTDSGAQRVRGSVPSTRRLAVGTPEPDSQPVQRAGPGRVAAATDPHEVPEAADEAELHGGIEARAGFGHRVAARLVDSVVIAIILGVFVVGGIALGAGIPAGTIASIDNERLGRTTAEGDGMPSYLEWEQVGRTQLPPDFPERVIKAEGESEQDFLARKQAYNAAYVEAKYQRDLWDWREEHYQADRIQVEQAGTQGAIVMALGIGFGLLLTLLYMPLTEAMLGASLGKKVLGLGVADADLRPIGLGKALLRQIGRLIPFGPLAALRANRLALHDQISGTQVVPAGQVRRPQRGGGRGRGGRTSRPGTARQARSDGTRSGTARHGRRRR